VIQIGENLLELRAFRGAVDVLIPAVADFTEKIAEPAAP